MKRLGHIALMTRDKAAMLAFYRDYLGMRVIYDNEHSTMVRLTDSEFDCGVVFIEAEDAAAGPLKPYNHLGFNVADRAEMAALLEKATAMGIAYQGPYDDPYIGYYAYLSDPDGNGIELSTPEGVNRY
jgi:catechol 2,3-dioxygenase-like lactoylglutathione lyase family enzyme